MSKKSGICNTLKKYWPLYLMMLPGCIYIFINNYIPMAGIVIAFERYNAHKGVWGSPFIGLKNFQFLFKTKDAWTITSNTIGYNFVFIVLGTILSITVAILLNEIRSKSAKQVYQSFMLVPFLISIVVVSYLVFAMLSSDKGFLNDGILRVFDIKPIQWYSEPKYWPFILVIVYIWKSLGYSSVLYYATIVGIDQSFYEAALVDGANFWDQVYHITLPNLRTTVIMLTLIAIGGIFHSDFGLFYQVPLDQGPLINVTNTIDTYVFRGLMQAGNFGMSSAAGLYQSFVGFILVFITNTFVNKIDSDSALF